MTCILTHLRRLKNSCLDALSFRLTNWTKPLVTSLPLATLTDLGRSKSELVAENATYVNNCSSAHEVRNEIDAELNQI